MEDSNQTLQRTKKAVTYLESELKKEKLTPPKSLIAFLVDFHVRSMKQPLEKLKQTVSAYLHTSQDDTRNAQVYIEAQKRMFRAYEECSYADKLQADKEEFLRNKIISLEAGNGPYRGEQDKTIEEFYNSVAEYLWFKKSRFMAFANVEKQAEVDRIVQFVKYIIPGESVNAVISLSIINKIEQIESLFLLYIGTELLKTLGRSLDQEASESIGGKRPANLLSVAEMHDIINSDETNRLMHGHEPYLLRNRVANVNLSERICNALVYQTLLELHQTVNPFIEELVTLTNNITAASKRTFEFMTRNPKALKKDIYPLLKDIALYYVNIFAMYSKVRVFTERFADFETETPTLQPNTLITQLDSPNSKIIEYSLYDDILKHKLPDYQILTFKDMAEFDNVELEYNGYDVVDLIEHSIVEMGDLSNGVLLDVRNGKSLVFRTTNNMMKYVQSRTHYTEEFKTLLRDNPSLVFLYQKSATREYVNFQISLLPDNDAAGGNKVNAEVQVPLHLEEFNIDHTYYWNEWDLRRLAIKMVNIRNKETVGCQTAISLFKVNNNTQVWPPVDATTMTGVEDGNNPIWPKNYMVGLRNK